MEFDQQFVEYIVKSLVNKPEEVKSERKIDEKGILITVFTAPEDTGYVIGKGGRTAVAIRTLLATLGAKSNQRLSFRIDAPDNGKHRDDSNAPMSDLAPMAAPAAAAVPSITPGLVSAPIDDMDQMSVDSLTF